MPALTAGKGTVAVASGPLRRRSVLVDGVAEFAELLGIGRFRGNRIFPGHGREFGKKVGPQADAIGPHQGAALVAAEMVFKPGLGVEAGRADVEAGGVVPRVRILPAEAGLPSDRRMQFNAVHTVVQPRRPTQQAATTAGHENTEVGWGGHTSLAPIPRTGRGVE